MSEFLKSADLAYTNLSQREMAAGDNTDLLFFLSYLLGHLSLVSSCDQAEDLDATALTLGMDKSLEAAFAVDRLSDQDKDGIKSLWQEIVAEIRL
ncbi:YfcL family protein [Nitrincola tapanii]|uniref:YfcL family protein n=1 Tax=Nitrincola tapanii TaxID=1708751 RepID=A0A5A9W4Y7_9GAMM|nr:YfcL family protein [Nitrincola tapanii]KAA0875149.1 hypothetical protein E1H14_06935 [Nitrincola tapanii]